MARNLMYEVILTSFFFYKRIHIHLRKHQVVERVVFEFGVIKKLRNQIQFPRKQIATLCEKLC